jgi:hypothetical protein
MNKSFVWMGLAASGLMFAWAGCGSSKSAGTGGAGTTGTTATTGTKSTTGTTGVTTGTGTGGNPGVGGGTGGTLPDPFECTIPATPPSGGSCVTVGAANDAGTGIECNPVTNAPCPTGQQCDTNFDMNNNLIGFVCFPSNNVAVCMTCDPSNNLACAASGTCFTYDNAGDSACAQYCCTDTDCGAGKCSTMVGGGFGPVAPMLGVCTLM